MMRAVERTKLTTAKVAFRGRFMIIGGNFCEIEIPEGMPATLRDWDSRTGQWGMVIFHHPGLGALSAVVSYGSEETRPDVVRPSVLSEV